MLTPHTRSRFGGAFWALVLAWLCAQSPQAAVFEVVSWVAGATHISHHDRLVAEVGRAILSGETRDEAAFVMMQAEVEERGKPAGLPVGTVIEKLLLVLVERERLEGDEVKEAVFARAKNWDLSASTAVEPSHPPPRAV